MIDLFGIPVMPMIRQEEQSVPVPTPARSSAPLPAVAAPAGPDDETLPATLDIYGGGSDSLPTIVPS